MKIEFCPHTYTYIYVCRYIDGERKRDVKQIWKEQNKSVSLSSTCKRNSMICYTDDSVLKATKISLQFENSGAYNIILSAYILLCQV